MYVHARLSNCMCFIRIYSSSLYSGIFGRIIAIYAQRKIVSYTVVGVCDHILLQILKKILTKNIFSKRVIFIPKALYVR